MSLSPNKPLIKHVSTSSPDSTPSLRGFAQAVKNKFKNDEEFRKKYPPHSWKKHKLILKHID